MGNVEGIKVTVGVTEGSLFQKEILPDSSNKIILEHNNNNLLET